MALSAVLFASLSRAQEPGCPPEVHRWVERAGRELGRSVRAEACHPGFLRLRLRAEGAPPLDVEVARGEGPAFHRVGDLRLSPLLEVSDFSAVERPRREALVALEGWLGRNPGVPLGGAALGAPWARRMEASAGGAAVPWCLVGAVGLLLALWRRKKSPEGPRAWAGLALLALAARFAFGLWSVLHVNGQGPLWLEGALGDGRATAPYGPGYRELFQGVTRLASALGVAPDHGLFAANALASASAVLLLHAVARALGHGTVRSALVAGALAVHPSSVRIAATESYFPSLVALSLGAAWCALRATLEPREAPGRAAAWGVAGALLTMQAARVHPSVWPFLALVPWTAAAAAPRRGALVAGGVTAGALAGLVLTGSLGPGLATLRAQEASGAAFALAPHAWWAWALAALVGALGWRRSRAPGVWLLGGAQAALAFASMDRYGPSELWSAAFLTLAAPWALLALGSLLPEGRRAQVAAAVALVAVTLRGAFGVPEETTEQREFAWHRRWLAALPVGCTVFWVGAAGPRRLYLPTYLARDSRPARLDAARLDAQTVTVAPGACAYYVQGSLCASAEGRGACARVAEHLALREARRARLPGVPSARHLPYDRPVVDVVVYRVARD